MASASEGSQGSLGSDLGLKAGQADSPPSPKGQQSEKSFSASSEESCSESTQSQWSPSSRSSSPVINVRRRGRSQSSRRSRSRPPRPPPDNSVVDMLSKTVINFLTLCGCLVVFGVFLVGSYDFFKNVEDNKCEMTWMYHPPRYVPISIGDGVEEKFPMYHLYAYVEGDQAVQIMSRENHQFTGIPVLYIPGNAGSHQQVRSLASVALWKYLDAQTPFHFDFFTVDLNEEFSGLYGYTLERQVEYTKLALNKIINLYEEYHRVVLIGHSMGGVIAKAVAIEDSSDGITALSNLIFTLATPHSSPVANFDPEQDVFYWKLYRNWTRINQESKISLVSIAGGDRDFLVASKLTRWNPFTTIHTNTPGIPGVWASTDHLCIVWCKQLVLTTVRSLYDMVEFNQRNKYFAITEKHESREAILNYHFLNRTSGKSFPGHGVPAVLTLPRNFDQFKVQSEMHCVEAQQRLSYAVFPVEYLKQNVTTDSLNSDFSVIVLTTNTKDKNWISGCVEKSPSGECTKAENLSRFGKIIPHIRRRRKMAQLSLNTLTEKYSDLIIRMDPHPFKTCVMLETFDQSERQMNLGGQINSLNKIFFNFTLSPYGFLSYLVAWKVEASTNNATCPNSHNLLAQFNHGPFQQSRFLKNESLLVRYSDWNVSSSYVTVFMEPTCNYTIKTSIALVESCGQFFRLMYRFLPSFYASVLLMTLYFQKDPNNWSSFHILSLSNAYHLSIFPGFVVSILLHFLPTDWPLMVERNEYSVILPIVSYMIAYCLVLAVSSGTWYAIITGGTAIHSVIIRVLSSRVGNWMPKFNAMKGFSSITEHVTEAAFEMTLTRFPFTIAVILLAVSFATCGSFGMALAVVFYLVKLFKIYEDLLEALLKAKIGNVSDGLSPMNFHFCSFMLVLVIGALNVPSLLHWTRGLSTETNPQWDLSMYLCLLLLPTVAILWQDFVPKFEPTIWNIHRYAFYGMGIACVLWGTHRLYVTAFLIAFVFLTLAICQLISVMLSSLAATAPVSSTTTDGQEPEPRAETAAHEDAPEQQTGN